MGVHKIGQIPHVSSGGMGVHNMGKRLHLSDGGKGVQEPYNTNIYKWFRVLSERMRNVRVVCGDWGRVCGGDWQDKRGTVGIFFDPPYAVEDRHTSVYHHDSTDVANDVREWCIKRGEIESYRIALCGYEEHDELKKHGWDCVRWKAGGGYGNLGNGLGKENSKREAIWFSPYCLKEKLLF
jgi:hypothetical protein